MSEDPVQEEKISEELHSLGKNLLGIFKAAWDHPERKRVQTEIENGLRELSVTLQQEAENFSKSPTGEKIKSEMDEIGTRIRSGETQSRIYDDLISALKVANSELASAIDRIGHADEASESEDTPGNSDS